MTLKEAARQLRYKEITIKKNLKRTQDALRKKGIILMKWGEGESAEYEIEYEDLEEED